MLLSRFTCLACRLSLLHVVRASSRIKNHTRVYLPLWDTPSKNVYARPLATPPTYLTSYWPHLVLESTGGYEVDGPHNVLDVRFEPNPLSAKFKIFGGAEPNINRTSGLHVESRGSSCLQATKRTAPEIRPQRPSIASTSRISVPFPTQPSKDHTLDLDGQQLGGARSACRKGSNGLVVLGVM